MRRPPIMTSAIVLLSMLLVVTAAYAQNPSNITWRQYESDNFIVYYPTGTELIAYSSVEVAETVHRPLVDMYGPLDDKVRIIIKDDEDFANGGAYFYNNKIEISATSLDYAFRSYSDWIWNVVTHELTHMYSTRQSMKAPIWMPMAYYQHIGYQDEKREDVLLGYPNVIASYPIPMFTLPAWLTEGVAQYQADGARFDSWDAHRDMILRQASLNDELLSLEEMSSFGGTGIDNEMVYDHGFALIRYIAERFGDESLNGLMRSMGTKRALTFDFACTEVLGISSDELYDDWTSAMKLHYTDVRDSLGDLVEGEPFRRGGFINGFPRWSPGGNRLAYVSNKGQDYSINACFVANLDPGGWSWKKKEKDVERQRKNLAKTIADLEDSTEIENARISSAGAFDIALGGGIQTAPVWLDDWNMLYNRRMPSDRYGSHWWDIYRYVINREDPREGEKHRISRSLRGTYPDLSPDLSELAWIKNEAGMNNLFIMDRDDNKTEQLTTFRDGTRIYMPRWSPDGSRIVFTIHQGPEIDIAVVDCDGSNLRYLVTSDGQDRDAVWNADGSEILFSSDVDGIANLYRMPVDDVTVYQLTNVIGGAFQPDISPADTTIAFSYYGTGGYEIHLMPYDKGHRVFDSSIFHRRHRTPPATIDPPFPVDKSQPYRMETMDFSVMPVVRNDRGNTKIGSYLMKSEVINQGDFLFSGAMSPTNRDTDIFAMFTYRKFIPTVFVEMYRQTRSVDTDENYMEEYGTITRKRVFDLNEIDFGLKYRYHDRHEFESRLIYSQYNARIDYTHFLTGPDVHKPYYTYSRGIDVAFIYRQNSRLPSRDDVINPRGGRKILARYDRFNNYFLDDFEYVGYLREKYTRYPYSRFHIDWTERIAVPNTKKHTLELRGLVSVIDRQVDDFYDSQLGGPYLMRGYTFYSMSGRKNIMGQALYRMPLLFDVRKSFLAWRLNHVYLSLFADIGKAWNKRSLNWSTDSFKRDAGAELRFDVLSFYNFPTMIQLSTAYGPDDTWIQQFDEENSRLYMEKDDQKPWKFYFSILFGFN
jgi:Tol biopolymer transport system component